jgi:hypothetical protein
MVDKKAVAAIMVAAAILTLIFSARSLEASDLMHEAAEDFLSNFEFSKDGLFVEPSLEAILEAQEPYRTHFLIYSFFVLGSGVTAICGLLYVAKDFMLEAVRRLSKGL